MFVQIFTILISFGLQVTAASYKHQSVFGTSRECPEGVHIVGVRGTLEEPGFGELGKLLPDLLAKLPGSDTYAIDYPGTGISIDPDDPDSKPVYDLTEYVASEAEGYSKLIAEISNFVTDCPDTGIVLMGYSQGAHVVGDALCGAKGTKVFDPKVPLDPSIAASIVAIIQLGDPTNRSKLPWHAGTSWYIGRFERQDIAACIAYGEHWQSYCDLGDFFCESGAFLGPHMKYVERYKEEINAFIVAKVKASQSRAFNHGVKNTELRV